MNSNKIGKYILTICITIFVFLIVSLFLPSVIFEDIPEYFAAPLILFLFFLFCISFVLIFYHSSLEKRKKAIKVLSIISAVIFVIAWFFKFMHWPGASILTIVTFFLFSFGTLPLIIKSRYEKRKTLISAKTLILSLADMISIALIILGFLSRVMHWPGGNNMIITGVVILIITFIFWNISFRKEVKLRLAAEEKLRYTLQEVEEKQKEITDSINYAKRIQEAIFPSHDFIKSNLPDYFLYYQPKDIVAGDFYWADKKDNTFLIASADCTGHGVPGALVSVVCCNALNRAVNEFNLIEPGKILDKTRELVLESFSKNGGDIKDGMDISLISISGNTVKWAGANNPLWYLSPFEGGNQKSGDVVLKEIKPNKQPIGKTDNPMPFTTHTIELQKGDLLYLFTDGFADQFGGPKGKKFKYKQFEELLVKSKDLSLSKQHEILKNTFNNWKGNLEQIDDISVIGIRF